MLCMQLPVLLKDSFIWIMVNLGYRKCFQLYEKINPVTHSVDSAEIIVCDLLAPKILSLRCGHFFLLKIQAFFYPLKHTGFPLSSAGIGPR